MLVVLLDVSNIPRILPRCRFEALIQLRGVKIVSCIVFDGRMLHFIDPVC